MTENEMCGKHRTAVAAWKRVEYNPRSPKEWPGGPLMDSRTSHADRRADWERKTAAQIEMIKGFCRDGRNCGE